MDFSHFLAPVTNSLAFQVLADLGPGVLLTLKLGFTSVALGAILALALALARISGNRALDWPVRLYITFFRGTPLIVQMFFIYYGFSQFPFIRKSILWPFLSEAYWCAILALTLNTAAYASEIVRGGLLSVPRGQVEAARACGMSRAMVFRRVTLPLAIRQALPGYGNEIISIIKATAIASTITLMEITGIAARWMGETYRPMEVFVIAGAIYLIIVFCLTRIIALIEYSLSSHLRQPVPWAGIIKGEIGAAKGEIS